jgi:DNA-binding NarL/FixJ family response regulator
MLIPGASEEQMRWADALASLSRREFELLRLAASGLDNGQIADTVTLSVRTVTRHLSNAYLKLGVSGRGTGGWVPTPMF